jgi:DNA-binding response OmpR family regulator
MNAFLPLREASAQPSLPDAATRGAPAQAKRVLLVEDDTATRRLTALLLARAGYSVDIVADGEAGWDALGAAPYDLLVTDNDMPRVTGMKLVERLRLAGLTLPVIIASGSQELGEAQDYPWLALAAILHKPFPFADLISAARRAVPMAPDAAEGAVHCLEPSQDTFIPFHFPACPDPRSGVFPETASTKHP